MGHKVKARVFNIDTNEYEELEFEVSDDVYKIITNGIGASYSIDADPRPDVNSPEYGGRHEQPTEADLIWAYNYNSYWGEVRASLARLDSEWNALDREAELRRRGVERSQARTDSDDG